MHINKPIFNNIKANINSKMNSFKGREMKILSYSIYIILLDQISKFLVLSTIGFERSKNIIPHLLNFTIVKNKGAAFSLFTNSTNILTFISIIVSLILITIILKYPPKSFFNLLGLAHLLGGTIGNGIDRLLKGYVVDFLDLVPINFPIFNLADVSINIAILCFMIDLIKMKDSSKINRK
tara:strand:- start:675 stop:1214 length:540 start_codon:yes stop_codon:yes gene_type:complete